MPPQQTLSEDRAVGNGDANPDPKVGETPNPRVSSLSQQDPDTLSLASLWFLCCEHLTGAAEWTWRTPLVPGAALSPTIESAGWRGHFADHPRTLSSRGIFSKY